jgi:5-methylcytosine-specific restriction protein A
MARLTMLRPRVGTLRTGVASPLEVARIAGRPWMRIRAQVLNADPLCVHCRLERRVAEANEVDHVVPLWEGGTNDLANLQGLCGACHKVKSEAETLRRTIQGHGGGLDLCGGDGRKPRPIPFGPFFLAPSETGDG